MQTINLQRRKLGLTLLTLAGLPAVGSSFLPALASNSRFKLFNVHLQVAQKAAKLNSNKTRLTILLPEGSRANIQPVAEEFTRLSGVSFEYLETSVDDINTRMFLDTQTTGSSYDIALPATFGIPDLVESGAIASLTQLAQTYQPDGFQKNSLYTIGDYYRDNFYGYQTDGDAYLMFYNNRFLNSSVERQSFYESHGYELKVPQTWEELDAMMAHFHNPQKGLYGGALFRIPTYMLWEWWVRFHAKGFYPLDNDLNPQINNQAGVKALEELIKATKFQTPNAAFNGLFDNWKEFSNGNIFCNIGWGGTQKYLNSKKSAIRGQLQFGPTPGGIVNGKLLKTSYFNWGWNYTVAKKSIHKEIAYLFTLFAVSPEMSTLSVREQDGYFDPFRLEHYEDSKIIDVYSKPFMDEHRQSMVNSIPDLYLKGQTQYYDSLRFNIAEAHEGKITPKKALDETAKVWKRLNFKFNRKIQNEQWHFLKSRYPDSVKNILR